MAIDINGLGSSHLQGAGDGSRTGQVARTEQTVAQQQTGKSSTTDTVLITDSASRLRNLEKSISTMPVVDSQRIESIRKAINDGDFDIEPDKVADKMISFENQFSQAIK